MYDIVAGDTLEKISRKIYGSEIYAGLIARANPGLKEPLTQGTSIILPNRSAKIPKNISASKDEVSVLIEGKRFRFWQSIRLSRALDVVDTLELSAPFEPDNPYFKTTFQPFSFKPIQIFVGGSPLFTGTLMSVTPSLNESKTIEVSAYATCGVLGDCTAPASAYPLQYNKQNLQEIATKLCEPFGLTAHFKESAGSYFSRVALKPTEKILDFLMELSRQRNFFIGSSEDGNLIFQKVVSSGTPVAILKQGVPHLISATTTFSPQEYYSHITGIGSARVQHKGGQYTVKNEKLKNILRPFTFSPSDADEGTLKEATESKIGRMYGNVVSYRIEVSTWRDSSGNLWEPNTLISLEAENAMIYKPYIFVVRSVEFTQDQEKQTASIDLILRGAFDGQFSGDFPWQ